MNAASPAVWERRLEAEGLGPIDAPAPRRQNRKLTDASAGRMVRRQEMGGVDGALAVDAWTTWARGILATFLFTCDAQRRVWRLYADGQPIGKIRTRTKLNRWTVTYHIANVKAANPPAPVENPWRKYVPPRHREPNDNQVLALLREFMASRKADMPKGEKIHYSRVLLKEDVQIRNIARTADRKNCLLDVDGYRHAGGIDFEFDTKINTGGAETRVGKVTVTIPWHTIKQADVETEVSET